MPDRINHLAVWVAAIVYYIFGAAWFTTFGAAWDALLGKPMAATPMVFVASFVLGLILAYATAIAITRRPEDQTAKQGISFALFMGIALYATQTLNQALYAGQPFLLWLIDTAYVVIGFGIVGGIVGAWKKRGAAGA